MTVLSVPPFTARAWSGPPDRPAPRRAVPVRHRDRAHGARRHRRRAVGRAHAGHLEADRPAVRAGHQPHRRGRAAAAGSRSGSGRASAPSQRAADRTERAARPLAVPAADRAPVSRSWSSRAGSCCSPSRPASTSAPASGPGPRDGLMTGLHARTGWTIWIVRTASKSRCSRSAGRSAATSASAPIVFALLIGPMVGFTLPLAEVPPYRRGRRATPAHPAEEADRRLRSHERLRSA